ncbi:MAG: thaumatin-like protein 1b [Fibrobacteres bacterium]|nr:thaumatin-like protein 1b [Fibrobacterota bacterium]
MRILPLALICLAMYGQGFGQARTGQAWPHDGKYGFGTRHLHIRNHLPSDIYVQVLSGGSSALKSDHFKLAPGADTVYETPNEWRASRLWARTEAVQSGPSTLIEWTMGSRDWYDISLVDGYNLPVTVSPVPGTYVKNDPNDPFQCGSISCVEDLLPGCPEALQKRDGLGLVRQCLSACSRYNKDEFCCRGYYDSDSTCTPAAWDVDYPRLFKNACPTAVTYAFDDSSNTFICPSTGGAGPDYEIGFGALRTSPQPVPIASRPPVAAAHRFRARLAPGLLRYALTGLVDAPDLKIGLFSADGRSIIERPLSASAGSLPLPILPAGVYHAVLSSAGRILETLEFR